MLSEILKSNYIAVHKFGKILEENPKEFVSYIRNIGKLPDLNSSVHLTSCLYLFLTDLPKTSDLI